MPPSRAVEEGLPGLHHGLGLAQGLGVRRGPVAGCASTRSLARTPSVELRRRLSSTFGTVEVRQAAGTSFHWLGRQ